MAPVYSLIIATEPLPADVWERIGLRRRETFTDDRHLIIYGQRTADDRLVFGGRGAPYHFGSRTRADLRPRLPRLPPAARGRWSSCSPRSTTHRVTHDWGGALGVPRDWCASVGLDRGTGLAWAGGYVGDGVGTTNLAGRTLRRPGAGPRHRAGPAAVGRAPSRALGAGAAALAGHQRRPAGDAAADAEERLTRHPSLIARAMAPLTGH